MLTKMIVFSITCIALIGVMALSVSAFASNIASVTPKIALSVRTNSSQSVGYDGYGQVSCGKGETLAGGGYYSGFREALSVYQNGPSPDGKTWFVSARYTPGGPHGGVYYGPAPTFEIYALCMKLVP